MLPETLSWDADKKTLVCLDQRKLPLEITYFNCNSYLDVAEAIETMVVRGAPAIGAAAAYGVALAAYENAPDLDEVISRLEKTRPTAVNLFWALERVRILINQNINNKSLLPGLIESEAIAIHKEDIEINKKLSAYGEALLPERAAVITHCNAGAWATCGYGTALGVFRAARENGKDIKIYADETRPRLQGGKITTFEMFKEGFDVTLIADSMASYLMSKRKIDAVITGADRVAMNGDTANKIGTYSLAVSAKYHNVPFYIAAPTSTFDINCESGVDIPIEERSGDEMRIVNGVRVIPEEINVWNPAFDVTPNSLIKGIITEYGVLEFPYNDKLKELLSR